MYVTGTIRGGTAGNSCNGITIFNSSNVPSYLQVNAGSAVIGGTSANGSTAAIGSSYSPAGASIAPSAVVINCDLTGGASGSGGSGNAAFAQNTSSIPTTITGNIYGTLANWAIFIQGSADVTVNGNVYAASSGAGGSSNVAAIYHNSGGLLTVNGNLIGSTSGVATSSGCVYLVTAGCKYTQNGNIIAGNSTTTNYAFWTGNSGHTIVINGNVTGGYGGSASFGVRSNNNSPVTINGNATGGAGSSGVALQNDGNASMTVNGNVTAGTGLSAHGYNGGGTTSVLICDKLVANGFGPGSVGINSGAYAAICNNAVAIIRFKKLEFGARGNTPINGAGLYQLIDDSTNTAKFYTSAAGTKTLVDGNAAGLMPAVTDVRSGVTYNAGNLTGTCAVPAANSVAAGVAVDNTTGTAVLTQANVWDYPLSSASGTPGSVGEKLKKTAIPADIIALG